MSIGVVHVKILCLHYFVIQVDGFLEQVGYFALLYRLTSVGLWISSSLQYCQRLLYINLVKQIYYMCNLNKIHFSDSSSIMSRTHGSSRRRPQRRRRRQPLAMSRTSSFSSITDSTMSLNIITVTLNMDTVNFLGISIVGQSNKGGDGGIYVGSIMKG